MFVIVKSLVITLSVSLGFAFSLKQFFGFWESFVFVAIAQLLVSFFIKNKTIQRDSNIINELSNNIDTLLEKQQVVVQCPCGKNNIPVVIFLDEETVIECDVCKNTFRVIADIQTQLITEPVNMENIYNKLKEQQYNQV
jgi:hypothetical protein